MRLIANEELLAVAGGGIDDIYSDTPTEIMQLQRNFEIWSHRGVNFRTTSCTPGNASLWSSTPVSTPALPTEKPLGKMEGMLLPIPVKILVNTLAWAGGKRR